MGLAKSPITPITLMFQTSLNGILVLGKSLSAGLKLPSWTLFNDTH